MTSLRSNKSKQKRIKRRSSPQQSLITFKKLLLSLFITSLVGSSIAIIYFLFYKSSYFLVQNIEISGTSNFVNKTDLWNFVEPKVVGERIFLINTQDLSMELSEMFLGAKSFEVKKKFPSEIRIFVRERIPLALLKGESSSDSFLVDNEGYILGIVSSGYSDLPTIAYSGDLKVGEFVDRNLVPMYFDLIQSLDENKIKMTSMSFHINHISLHTEGGIKVLISNKKDVSFVLSTLSKLLKSLQFENKNPKSIDLRYDKVVVSY